MDYVFFSERLRDDFLARAADLGVSCALATDAAAEEAGWLDNRVAGVAVTLDDGAVRTIRLEPGLASRLLHALSAEEIHDLVTAVAKSLAGPEEPRLCKKV